MKEFERKVTLRVVGVHAAILFLLITIPAVKGCFRPRPREIVTFIEFGGPAPAVNVEQVTRMTEPEPPAPEPEPAPVPEPEPVKPKPVPKPKKKAPEPKPEEKAPAPETKKTVKPKWKPVDPKDIKIGKKVGSSQPSKPTVSASDIQKALSGIATPSGGDPSRFNEYYARVMRLFYDHWTPPATASSATGSAVVKISMRKNGQITKRARIRGSGDALYDRTVMEAVNKVSMMPKPPSDYPYDYVEVIFTLDN
jgi:protein TonB